MSKAPALCIRLLAGLGVEGDAHAGATTQHRSRVAKDPSLPNLRQVHLFSSEFLERLRGEGFALSPGELGENVLTRDVPLLDLPVGTRLRLGRDAVVELTGLRNPCVQIDRLRAGLLAKMVARDERGGLIRRAGVMSVVITTGDVYAGDEISIELPVPPHVSLGPV